MNARGWQAFASRLGVTHSLIQAPMAGGYTTPELVAAVSNAGAFGSLAAALLQPDEIVQAVRKIRELTQRPFGINLFAPSPAPDERGMAEMLPLLAGFHHALGIPPPTQPTALLPDFSSQLEAVIASAPRLFSFTFGVPDPKSLARVQDKGILLAGTATSVAEAKHLESLGIDVVVAQGAEAGGHRGTFIGSFEASLVGTLALVPQVVDAVKCPVLAAGGIMDGRGIAAARMLGATGAQVGTAFLTCKEAGTSPTHREALRNASDTSTVVTRAFSGKPARGLANVLTTALAHHPSIPSYPLQHALTLPLRKAAAQRGDPRFMSLYSGQGAPLTRELTAGELVQQLMTEAERLWSGG